MHACGHDGHVACLLGAAAVLADMAGDLPGKVKLVFQPAEECGGGAERMIEAGALDRPKVDAIFGLHAWPQDALGQIAVADGPIMAGTRAFDITFGGEGGHAAYPHLGTDVIAAAAQFVTNLQFLRTRRIDPVEPAVISVGSIVGGHIHNVLPATCALRGTIRALQQETLDQTWDRLCGLARDTAAAFGAEAAILAADAYPPLTNHPGCADLVAEAGRSLLGPEKVRTDLRPSMGAEDFAYFARRVPAAYYRMGLRPAGVDPYPPLHHPRFDFNDEAIPIGVAMHCLTAWRFLHASPTSLCG
jgi:amidohydrolase